MSIWISHPYARTIAVLALLSLGGPAAAADPMPGAVRRGATLVVDWTANLHGGIRRSSDLLACADLWVERDLRSGVGQPGARFRIRMQATWGGDPSQSVGDFQIADNIEAVDALRLYEAWYEHALLDGELRLLVGLHDFNGEFYVTEHSTLFLHSAFGIGAEVAQVGPSIFPTTALALRLRWRPARGDGRYLLLAAYDGVPGDPADARKTRIILEARDGIFWAVEAGRAVPGTDPDERGYAKIAVGAWLHTREFASFDGSRYDRNAGAYLLAEGVLAASGRRTVAGFVRAGLARSDRNQADLDLSLGLVARDLVPGRPDDRLGLAVTIARASDDYRRAETGARIAETALELTWSMRLGRRVRLQPDLQYIVHPGMAGGRRNAAFAAVRLTVEI